MDRSQSDDHIVFGTPETERGTFTRLPPRGGSEPRVPVVRERSRSSQNKSTIAPQPTHRSVTHGSNTSRHRGTAPPTGSGRHRPQGSHSSATSTPRPYETPLSGLPPIQTSPSPPPPRSIQALPVPATDSADDKSSPSSSPNEQQTDSPASKQSVKVFPGTMAARSGRAKSSSSSAAGRRQRAAAMKQAKPGWKVALRRVFQKTPVDETQLERIEGRHWTEE